MSLGNEIDQTPEEIRREIEATKASLSSKFENLGSELRETVGEAKSAVEESVHGLRDNLSFEHHYGLHPWSFFAGAVGVGCLIGRALVNTGGSRSERALPAYSSPRVPQFVDSSPKTSSLLENITGGLTKTFDKEIQAAKKLAIGTALGIVRDIARQSVPAAAAQRTAEVIDEFTRSLGGEPLRDYNVSARVSKIPTMA